MRALPQGWRWVTLNDLQADEPRAITDGPFGSNLTSAHYSDSGARVIRLQNIGDGRFVDAEAFIPMAHYETLRAHEVRGGDLVVASLGEMLPKACLVPDHVGPAIVKADCIRVRVGDHVDPRWVLYSMQTPATRRWATDQLHGVGRPRLGLKVIRQIPIPLPPLEEQRRIVDTLEDHLSRLDVATGYVEGANSALGGLWQSWLSAQSVMNSAQFRSLGDVLAAPLRHGKSVPTAESGFPVLRLTAIKHGRVDLGEHKIGAWSAPEAKPYLVSAGDFLVARGNGSIKLVGRGGLVGDDPDPVAYPDTAIRVRADPTRIAPAFLALVWDAHEVRKQIESMARTTAGIHKVNQVDLRSVGIPVPTLTEQTVLIQEAREFQLARQRLRASTKEAASHAKALRWSLLEAAFSGRLIGHSVELEQIEEPAHV